jgi:hypothetical protein
MVLQATPATGHASKAHNNKTPVDSSQQLLRTSSEHQPSSAACGISSDTNKRAGEVNSTMLRSKTGCGVVIPTLGR